MEKQINIVPLIVNDEEIFFDQTCCWGCRAGNHAVYCENENWSDHPRKCRRTWFTGGKTKDEDCEGFEPQDHVTTTQFIPPKGLISFFEFIEIKKKELQEFIDFFDNQNPLRISRQDWEYKMLSFRFREEDDGCK